MRAAVFAVAFAAAAAGAPARVAGAQVSHVSSATPASSGAGADADTRKRSHGATTKGEGRSPNRRSAKGESGADRRSHGEHGVIHMMRSALGGAMEDVHIRLKDIQGRIPGAALKTFERMMRQGNASHPPDPRLVALIGIVSDHFGGRPLQVVSGYRAYTPTQYTPHSNHNYGKALDFRIEGVANETLRDFCLTLRNAGCGYYPNSTFVHLDVRDTKAYWVDRSRPGEPPLYDKPGVTADEGTSDVPNETSDVPQEPVRPEGKPARDDPSPARGARSAAPGTTSPTEQSL